MEWLSKPEPRQEYRSERHWSDDYNDFHGFADDVQVSYAKPAAPKKSLESAGGLKKTASAPLMELHAGDGVEHSAFGRGMVLSVRAMGGDALIEVAFDTVGTKKLMLKAAASHLKKL